MSKYKYSDIEQQINNVLKHQEKELVFISFPNTSEIDSHIQRSEDILKMLGVSLPDRQSLASPPEAKRVMVLPTWESLCKESEASVGNQVSLEELFLRRK